MSEEVDYKELYLRALADYDNLKKRSASVAEDNELIGVRKIVRNILCPLTDAMMSAKLYDLLSAMNNSLKGMGISVIDEGFEGKDFDPDFMECISTIPTDDGKLNGKIVKIDRVGYVDSKDRVIVPAMVSVYLK